MRFNASVVMFEFAGYPIVGNLDTGYIIGLTQEGAALCAELMTADILPEQITNVDQNLFHHLEKGLFFSDKTPPDSIPSAYIHVTQRCNLSCVGCYSNDDGRNTIKDPSTNQLKRALSELAGAGVEKLVISGGEPFLRNDLAELVSYAHIDCGIAHITVITNGTIANNRLIDKLSSCVDSIAVSVDGYSAECLPYIRREQRFTQLVETIKTIKGSGIQAHIIPTVHSKNLDDIPHYIALANDLGVTLNFSILSCREDDNEASELLLSEADQIKLGKISASPMQDMKIEFRDTPMSLTLNARSSCGAGKGILSVASDGTVYPCHMLHDKEFALGNIFFETLESILEKPLQKRLLAASVTEFSDCNSCDIQYLCGGGCRARVYYMTGAVLAKDPYCAMIKKFYGEFEASLAAAQG